ncbi:MAG: transglycosylase SLT domain-containing protein [Acidobacteriota bacterium]|nr:transglycosylase SLT domain-containing protein [Acidobacteriota bacterium]
MKTNLFKVFSLTAIIIFNSISFVNAQVNGSGLRNVPADNTAEVKFNQISSDAGRYFKEAMLHFRDNERSKAREKFDRSVEVFLMSGVNVRASKNLSDCYNQLIETVYRIEFPSSQQPQIRSLSATCGWNIDNKLADDVVAKLAQPAPQQQQQNNATTDKNLVTAVVDNKTQSTVPQAGFTDQGFEVSPLDELAKLELTPQEQDVESDPVVQQQYELVKVAVANKSLGFTFQVHPMIQQYINYYQGRGRQTMEIGLYRSGMFMRMARQIFREEGIPENIVWLGQVESAWKPSALSWAAASGLWQFIPGTGARYGLRRTAYIDERNGFEKATKASAQYLKFLANRYNGNWELALAAYNSGEGNVDKAIRRAGVANFWVAYPYLPKETRNYVPNILATILIANNPQRYGFGHVRPAPPLNYAQVRVPPSTSLGLLAQAADTSVEYLRYLNPELRSNMSPPEPYNIRVPAGKANEVFAVLRRVPSSNRNNATVARVVAGETLENVSRRTGVPLEQLQAVNGNAIPQSGKVVVPNGVRKTNWQRPTTPTTSVPTGGVRVVKAQSGDTVAKLASRYGASAVEVAKFNGLLPDSQLAPGREIRIPSR